MTELVTVSGIEDKERLKTYLADLFKRGQYTEMSQAIGMHSILIDPQNTIGVQSSLYHFALELIKERIRTAKGKSYSSWYTEFPKILDRLVASAQVVTDKRAVDVLASRRAAYGPFKSLEEFFSWALDDRRLPFAHIVKYIEKTA